MNFYIADTHFGHSNVIKFDNRPFENVEEMDKKMIEYWNNRVTDDDDVYIIGDFVYRSDKPISWYCNKLKGKKHLILGNHDRLTEDDKKCFISIDKMLHIIDGRDHICACHFPIAEWNGFHKGHYHIFAHIHNRQDDTYQFMRTREKALNAGCMINQYQPVTLKELIVNNRIYKDEKNYT